MERSWKWRNGFCCEQADQGVSSDVITVCEGYGLFGVVFYFWLVELLVGWLEQCIEGGGLCACAGSVGGREWKENKGSKQLTFNATSSATEIPATLAMDSQVSFL